MKTKLGIPLYVQELAIIRGMSSSEILRIMEEDRPAEPEPDERNQTCPDCRKAYCQCHMGEPY